MEAGAFRCEPAQEVGRQPTRVIRPPRVIAPTMPMSDMVRISDLSQTSRDFRFVPCVDGSGLARRIFTSQTWSVQPCVRPLGAVHMTAGHNALRGLGPGQNLAFENAMAQVGCPDRRIDRLCFTVLFALPTFTSRPDVGAISLDE